MMDQSKLGKDKKLTDKPESVFPTSRLISHESDNSCGRIPKLRICLRPNNQENSLSSPSSQDDDVNKSTPNNRISFKNHKGAHSLIDESSLDSNSYDSEETKTICINNQDEKRLSLPVHCHSQQSKESFTPNITMTRRKSALAKLQSNEDESSEDLPQSQNLANKAIKIEKVVNQTEFPSCDNTELSATDDSAPNSSRAPVSIMKNQANYESRSQFKRCTRRTSLQEKNGSLVDLISPDSILTKVNFKSLINKTTFAGLPASLQFQLIKYLPHCDKTEDQNGVPRAHQAAFQNEFLAKALSDFPNRIRCGEFIKVNDTTSDPEVDKWKQDYFEEYWGQSTASCNAAVNNEFDSDDFASHNSFKAAKVRSTSSSRRKRLLPTCPKMVTRKSKQSSLLHANQSCGMRDGGSLSDLSTADHMKQESLHPDHSRVLLTHTDSLFTENFNEEGDHSCQSSQKCGTPMTLRRQRVPTRRWRQHQEERRRMRDIHHRPKTNSISESSSQQIRLDAGARSSSLTSPSGSSGEAESALSGFSKPSPPTSKPPISNIITTSPLSVSRSPCSPMPPPTDQLTCRTGSDLMSRLPSGPSSNTGGAGNEPLISPMAPPRKTKTLAAVREKMRALRQMKEGQRATPLTQHGCNSDMGFMTSPLSPSTLLSTFEEDSLDRMSASISSLGHCDKDSIDSCQPFNLGDIQFDQHLLDPNLPDDNLESEKQMHVDLFPEIDNNATYSPSISSKLSNIQTSSSESTKPVDSTLPNLSTVASSQILANTSESSKVSTSSDDNQKTNLPQQQFVLIPNPKNSSLILCRATPIYSPGVSPETGEAHSFIIHTANGPVALINTQNSNQLSHASLLSAIAKSLDSKEENTPTDTTEFNLNATPTSSQSTNNVSAASALTPTIDESVSQKLIEAVRNKIAMSVNNQNKPSISTTSSSNVSSEISKPQSSSQSVSSSPRVLTLPQCQQTAPILSQTTIQPAKCVVPSANNLNLSAITQPQNLPIISQITTTQVTASPIIRNGFPNNSTNSQVMLRTIQPSFNLQIPHTSVQIQERPTMTANIIRPRNFSPFVSTVQAPTSSYGVQPTQMLHQIIQNSDSSIRQSIPSQYIMGTFQTSNANQLSTVATPFVGKAPMDQTPVPLQLLFNTNQMTSPVIVGGMPGNPPLHLPVNMSPGVQPQYVSQIKTSTLQPVVANVSTCLHPAYRPIVNQKGMSEYKSIKRKNKPISKIPPKRRKSFNTNDTDSVSNQSIAVESTQSEPVISVSDTKKESTNLINEESKKSKEENSMFKISNSKEESAMKTDSLKEVVTTIQLNLSEQENVKESVEDQGVYSEKVDETEFDGPEVSKANMEPVVSDPTDPEECSINAPNTMDEKGEVQEIITMDEVVQSENDTPKDNYILLENTDQTIIQSDSSNPLDIDVVPRGTECVEICEDDKSLIKNIHDSDGVDDSKSSELEEDHSSFVCGSSSLTESPSKGSNAVVKLPKDELENQVRVVSPCRKSCSPLSNNASLKLNEEDSTENTKDNAYDSDNALDLSMPSAIDAPNDSPLDLTTQDKSSPTTFLIEKKKTCDAIMEPKSHLVADILNQHNSVSSDSQSGAATSNSHPISLLSSSNSPV